MNRNRKLGFVILATDTVALAAQDQVCLQMQWTLAVNCMMNAMNDTVAQNTVMNCFNNASVPI